MAEYTSDDFVLVSPTDSIESLGRLSISPHAWDLSCSMSEGQPTVIKSFIFRLKDEVDSRKICPSLVRFNPAFPQMGSRLPEDKTLAYYGNGNLEHLDQDARLWVYKAEYTPIEGIDHDGNGLDENTLPWKLPPKDITITYPEEEVRFDAAYNDNNEKYQGGDDNGTILVPVTNSAGDFFEEKTVKKYKQYSFTYCLRESTFSVDDGWKYDGSVNKSQIKLFGVTYPAETARIESLAPIFHEDRVGTRTYKTKWWEISISIRISPYGDKFRKRIVNKGKRAKFVIDSYVNANGEVVTPGQSVLELSEKSEKVFSWRTWDGEYGQVGQDTHIEFGNIELLYQAMMRYRQYLHENQNTTAAWPNEMGYESDVEVPLLIDGRVDIPSIMRLTKPNYLSYKQYRVEDWAGLSLPTTKRKYDMIWNYTTHPNGIWYNSSMKW